MTFCKGNPSPLRSKVFIAEMNGVEVNVAW